MILKIFMYKPGIIPVFHIIWLFFGFHVFFGKVSKVFFGIPVVF